MSSFTWLRARPRALASAGAVTAAAVTITTLAFVYEGLPTTEVDLHDGGVWVTKRSSLMVGHFNHESQVLDGGLRTTSDDYDILQSGSTVLVVDDANSSVSVVDPAMVSLSGAASVPGDAKVALGGSTAAILDRASGDLWVLPAAGVGSFQIEGTDPIANLGEGADVAIGVDGVVHGASAESAELVTVRLAADDTPEEPVRSALPGVDENSELSITAVGDKPVVLDIADGTLIAEGRETAVEGGRNAVLQQPSAASDAVTVSTASALVRVPFDGSDPTSTDSGGEGAPADPVWLEGCAYAAWSGSGRFVRDCAGDADDLDADIDGIEPTSLLQFRVNRDVVVLNDVIGGATWMAAEDLQRVDNWDELTPPEGETENEEQTTEETTETVLPERSEINTPPDANDDDLGVRPGRTTTLPILDNDSDPDGDVLTTRVLDGGPSVGEVQSIDNGRALQIAVPEDASGSASFTYEVADGRGGTDTARVSLNVRGWDVNAAPTQKRVTTVAVEAGGTITYNVLPDWIDPDGDDVFLGSVVTADGDEADYTSDGRITYRAVGNMQGRKDVEITVSDGTDATVGIVRFDVRPVGSIDPVTNADYVAVRTGQTATVSPLANDVGAGREPLRLARVDPVPGTDIVPDYGNKTFTFRSATPGTYYVQYLVAAGAAGIPGIVRVDVLPEGETDLPPVAVRDVALLPSGGEVLVNVLTNDSDPSGGILVVQSVTVEPGSGIAVAVLNHETLRISDQAALSEQVRITYRISNGSQSAEGDVIVIPIPAPAQLRPPVANDDQVVVRAGDVVTIPVLDNDYHPNGDTIHLAPDLVPPLIEPEDGEIFVSQDTVRFRASDEPGTVYATYEAVDSTGQKDAGYITIQVLPVNADTNAAPRPRDLTARVLSGSRVRVAVPLDGIDSDGDSVELLGLASSPAKGRVVENGSDYLVYEAFDDTAGVDAFTYRVRDRLGAEATAGVRIGIAPPEGVNQAPYAVKDTVIMRPDRSVAVPVLANDSDPDGDEFGIVRNGLILPDVAGLKAKVEGNRVVVTSPSKPVETSLQYTIRDARGAEAKAVLQITVADDVPLQKPIARDDYLRAADVEDGVVDLEVLANDEDPDGTVDDLDLTVADADSRVLADGTVRVTLGETGRLATYTITDRDGNAASAFIHVPALSSLPPTMLSTEPVEVKSGETVELPLDDHVRSADGSKVIITEAAKVTAAHSDGATLVKDQTTLVYTSAAGYFGPDAITFEVTDGTGPDDPEGRKATLTLPITVLPPENQQPAFVNGQMDVAPGEDPTTLDLGGLTTDPDPEDVDRIRYQIVGGSPDGMTAAIDGDELRVSAAADTRKGTGGVIRLRIEDGTTEPIEGVVNVRVIASTRELPTANDDIVPEAHQGKTVTVPVLANDVNPFPDKPLEVTAAVIETGEGQSPVIEGDQVKVTPDEKFFGTMVVRYRIQDATGDPDREVEGRIRLTVQGKPDAPGTPTVSSVQDRTVVLSWTPPANNGAEIERYLVSSTAGNYEKECLATTCTLDGLTNNVKYNFTVVAENRVGPSEASPPSEEARPDARPDTPAAPTLVFGDRSLNVSWVTPSTPGSPVEKYTLEISPAPPSGISQKTDVVGNSIVWDGLQNGVAYQVRVQAHNLAPDPSSFSPWSVSEIPARAPEPPASPSVNRLDPVGNQAQLEVVWTPPVDNGDAVSAYELQVMQGSSVVNTVTGIPGTQTRQAVNVATSQTDYTFRVRASNKAGWSAWGAPSAPRRAFGVPGAPTGVSLSTPTGNSAVVVSYGDAAGNGASASEIGYEYSLSGGGWTAMPANKTIGNLSNGTTYTIRVRAYTAMDGVRYTGPESAPSNGAIPYGPVRDPGVKATRDGTSVLVEWSAPAPNGRSIAQVQIRINGGGWENVSNNGSRRVGNDYDQRHTIDVRAYDSAQPQQVSRVVSDAATTAPRPQPKAWVSRGAGTGSVAGCSSGNCHYFEVNTQDFPAGRYQVYCYSSGQGEFAGGASWNLPANGSVQLGCYYGYYGEQVWVRIVGYGESEKRVW
ncbi:Ig-like domain-containing protein [Microbacterium sp. M3]|uniref:Ig-like domain-containing protein n=1 Tax=Microbacterium arthrosphaerae TaxID=792652 RepID=A0ABU4H2L8_9MICO|nr:MULTISPECIES: Ig-like domain-containing protein [Microbacterium]MDW4573578.1 Ig-like domain-containing protein [Microbacterium arthrosphaerae]MDW7607433.1 Ig-like domain-containing protein [Microbacterium sp. M3]